MPKATLTFNLPEEQEEFNMASKASSAYIALHEYDQYLRARLKYEELPEAVNAALQEARDKLNSICNEFGVEF